jgi:hypothetical protein
MKSIRREAIAMMSMGLAPLAEQKRIVARAEESLRQCGPLAAPWHQSRTLGAHLLESTLLKFPPARVWLLTLNFLEAFLPSCA